MNLIAIHNKTCATSRYAVFTCLLLVIVTLLAYLQVGSHEFVTFDDGLYITESIRIQNRTNPENIAWSFTTTHSSNWQPLTWMPHMLEVSLFDMHPGSHHLMSLFFHLVNSLLLFSVFQQMTGHLWQSAFVALLHDGKTEKAIRHFKAALKIKPNYIGAWQNLQKAESQY